MRAANVAVIYRKEFTDMFRDRKTLLNMFLFPIVLFPLLSVGFNRFERSMRAKVKAETPSIMLLGAEHAPALAEKLRQSGGFEVVPVAADYKARITERKLRAAVEIPAGFASAIVAASGEPPALKIYYYQTESRSEAAVEKIEEFLTRYRQELLESRMARHGLSAGAVKPIEVKTKNVAAEEKVAGSRFAMLLPYFIVFLCFMGAMGPAIDLTAGEKERGTLETILASAVGRDDLVLGKFLLILTASVTTTVMSLLSYAVTMKFSTAYMQEVTGGYTYTIGVAAIAGVFLVVLPMSVLFSAALFTVALFAKSYKEAQNYIGPMMMVIILPAMAALLPGVDLNPALALVPILNVSLAARELFTGSFPLVPLAITFASTCAFAAVALLAAFRLFQSESVLFRA
jgi:sodium transport system permease protein